MFDKKENEKSVSFLNEHAGEGFENITQDDLKMPFLNILQKGSPQVDKNDVNFIQGAEPGMFFNNVTKKLYGTTIELIPVKYEKLWMEWKPDRGGLIGPHIPGSIDVDKNDFSNWIYNGNNITETLFFYVLIAGHFNDGPITFTLSSTGIKHGKNWNTQIVHTRLPNGKQAPYFSSVWKLTSMACKNDKGTWYQIGDTSTAIERKRFINQKECIDFILPAVEALAKSSIDFKQLENNSSAGGTQEELKNVPY